MSGDMKIYAILDEPITKAFFDSNELFDGSYLQYDEKDLPSCLREFTKKVIVRYSGPDYSKACENLFGCDYGFVQYERGGGDVTFYSLKSARLGTVTKEQLDKYCTFSDEECYIVPAKRIASTSNWHGTKLESGLYSADEILDEAAQIASSDKGMACVELVYALVLALKEAKGSGKIYISIE